MRSSSFMNESHGYVIHIRHIHTSAVECSPTAHRYTVCGRREHLAEERVLWGRPLSMSLHCTHITPIDIHIIYTSPSCATEVNAQHPNAIDRHVRVVQWKHWCRDKCRRAHPRCHVCDVIHTQSPDYIVRVACAHRMTYNRRWLELVKAIQFCNARAQHCL